MDYAADRGMAGGVIGQANPLAQFQAAMPKPTVTMAARLEKALQLISGQCQRIENAIARVNGVPVGGQSERAEKIAGTAPLAQSVQFAEELGKRIADLAVGLDQIA